MRRSEALWVLAPLVCLLAAAALIPGPQAARLPEWARAVADTAPPLPEGVPEHRYRVLLSEIRSTIQPDGTLRVRKRLAQQALTAFPFEISSAGLFLGSTARAVSTKAWHLPPDEKAKRSWMTPVDITLSDTFMTDQKVRATGIERARKGSIAFFDFEAVDRPHFLSLSNLFYQEVPILLARYELEVPEGWSVGWAWLRVKGPEPAVSGRTHIWQMSDVPVPPDEPLAPSPDERAPLLAVHVVPPEGAITVPATFADWKSVSTWYEGLIRGHHEADPAIESAVSGALAAEGDFFSKVRSAGRYVRDRVRYVAIELGIGGWKPHLAAETLANLYGDCKDKGTLFRSMLAVAGIPSYPVLISLGTPDTVPEEMPVLGFNHFVVAVPVPDGAQVPDALAHAIVDGGSLGRLFIVDTTDEKTSIGTISRHLAGQRGLVVAGERGQLVTIPEGDPNAHRLERRIDTTLEPDRSMRVSRISTYLGSYASEARGDYSNSAENRRKTVETRVFRIWGDGTLQQYEADQETDRGEFIERLVFRRSPLSGPGAAERIALFPGAAEDLPRVPLSKRKTAVDYDHARTIRYEVSFRGWPADASLPEPRRIHGDGWTIATTFSREGPVLTASWMLALSRTRFEPEAFAELRKLWSAVSATADAAMPPAP